MSLMAGTLATGALLAGCAQTAAPPMPTAAAPAISSDGIYRGTITLTGAGAGVPGQGCATGPAMVLQVRHNAFTYTQAHPDLVAPGLGTTSYTGTVAQGGGFNGQSALGGSITGTIAGSHMAGTIDGVECVYSFTADRG
jgi:hypothetical protein